MNSAGVTLVSTSIRGCSSTFSTTTFDADSRASRVPIVTVRSFELDPGSHLQKLVGIEREHEVGSVARQRFARERRHALRLPVSGIRVMHHPQRQAFGLQLGKDAGGAVERTVIDDEQSVDDAQVVPHEGLDDIGLVAHHRYAEKPHDQIVATVGAGDGSGRRAISASAKRMRRRRVSGATDGG